MTDLVNIERLDVETPLGVVHLAAFPKVSHREVIFRILSEVTGRPVSAADLVQTELDPRPCFPQLDLDVNWTHSGKLCVVAYTQSPDVRVGVDLEFHSPRRLPVAERFFSAQEVEYLRGLDAGYSSDEPSALAEFFRLWCRKEALFKCVGGSFFTDALGRSVMENPLASANHQVHFVDLSPDAVRSFYPNIQNEKKGADLSASLCIAVARWPR